MFTGSLTSVEQHGRYLVSASDADELVARPYSKDGCNCIVLTTNLPSSGDQRLLYLVSASDADELVARPHTKYSAD